MAQPRSIRVETGARLHFGLLDTAAPFGGLGAMIDRPETILQFNPADQFTLDQALQPRGMPIVERLCHHLGIETLPPIEVHRLRAAPAHCGYGSGTQLSLAIAEGLCKMLDSEVPPAVLAAQIAQRGKRSAVGIHGYFHGGMIFEQHPTQQQPSDFVDINPIDARLTVPSHWRIVLARPAVTSPAMSGEREANEFSKLAANCANRRHLAERVRQKVLPAVASADFDAFTDALSRYNHDCGMLFAAVQGGPYNGPEVTELIEVFRACGAAGVGQSSWGPGVFAWCENEPRAHRLAAEIEATGAVTELAGPLNTGRRIHILPRLDHDGD